MASKNLIVGQIHETRTEGGFVTPESSEYEHQSIFVPTAKLKGAVRKDRVAVRLENSEGRLPGGRVVEVLERARRQVVGKMEKGHKFGFVRPTNPKVDFDVYLPRCELKEAEQNQIVVAFIEDWGDGSKSPEGSIAEVLGYEDDPGVGILSILKDRELPEAFPESTRKAADRLSVDWKEEAQRRLDLRRLPCFTIDPREARDFDDAFTVERLADGHFRIGVHIADVSHFVAPETPLDEAARERATSVYLVDRVLPMLPRRLSADLCSLVPNEDRLTYSVLLTMTQEAEVVDYEIRETLIRSRYRLTYQQAQAILEAEPLEAGHKEIMFEVQTLRALAKQLKARRDARGSLDFDLPETQVDLDDEGFPVDIRESLRLDSMRLVEEFMLLVNETVARHISDSGEPSIYRVNLPPTNEKRESLEKLLTRLGYHGEHTFSAVLAWARGREEEELVNETMVRSLQRAYYTLENQGHFGLASTHYTHFTSPIRRYVDLQVHRIVKGLTTPGKRPWTRQQLREIAEHASLQERAANDAERDTVALKQAQFMAERVGRCYPGTISQVLPFGVFVRLNRFLVEGLVPVHQMVDDFYLYDDQECCLRGRDKGRTFQVGQAVEIKVIEVDVSQRQLTFQLED